MDGPDRIGTEQEAWAGVHTFIVPPDIVAVQRRSPLPIRKRTPWHPHPDGTVATERAGAREWFSDRIFVEAQPAHRRTGYGTSTTVHSCAIVLLIGLFVRPGPILPVRAGPSLVMPAMMSMPVFDVPVTSVPAPRAPPVENAAPTRAPRPPGAAPAPAESAAPPVEAPSGIKPETGAESGTGDDGVEGGVQGGVAGGIVGGIAGGAISGALSAGPSSSGPLRVGGGIKPPRKTKDVKPVYPLETLADRVQGTVIIEATISSDGKVADARVLQSIPSLDRSALDAVRQWEYEPPTFNGMPVTIIMTVVIRFSVQ